MKNIGALLRERATVSPGLEAFVEPETGVRETYRQLNGRVNRCADALATLGLESGDRVAMLMPNGVEFVSLFYAAAKLGLVAVPLNTRLAAAELDFIVADSGARALIHDHRFDETVATLRERPEQPNAIEHWLPAAGDGDTVSARMAEATQIEPEIRQGGTDTLFIMYTSGTTGRPKGVVHTHDSVHCAASSWAMTMDARYQDRMLLPLPMFHVAALTCVFFCALRGCTVISMPEFDPARVWSLIVGERVTTMGAVPAILNFMRQVPAFESVEAPDFRYFITGAAPMPKALIEIYAAKGMQVVQGYALTESCGGGSFLLGEDALRKIGSAGRATMFSEIRLRQNDGTLVEQGSGEVVIRADFLLKEYWNRPEATRDAFHDGWFRTGDVADIDDEGYLFIRDRIKDMIISGGENIYPAEIEDALIGHPSVREVAVIGLPDERWGEIPCAIVVGDESSADEAELLAYCETRLARYKLPKRVIFADAIPRNAAGKALKHVLRSAHAH